MKIAPPGLPGLRCSFGHPGLASALFCKYRSTNSTRRSRSTWLDAEGQGKCRGLLLVAAAQHNSGLAAAGAEQPGAAVEFQRPRTSWVRLPQAHSPYDAEIATIAIPALASLVLDPVMNLVNSALVGRIGTSEIAGVGCGSMVMTFCTFPFQFLLYVTTPAVARAVSKHDKDEASKLTCRSLQLALVLAFTVAALGNVNAAFGIGCFTKNPDVSRHALTFLRCRLLAVPALLCINAMAGCFRGHKDTRTPLIASLVANVANATMVATFIFRFGWGVSGAALATTGSQYICAGIMFYLLVRNKILQPRHLAIRPALADWAPMLKAGAALSVRSIVSICVPLFATSRVGTYGTVALATNELMRQLYIGSLTLLAGFDISAQALVASYLGQGNAREARAVSARIMQIAVASATVLGSAILFNRFQIPRLFSRDAAVILLAGKLMPILACTVPFDAMASILDGTLLGASETSYISAATIINSLIVLFALTRLTVLFPGLATVWLTTKLMTFGRIITGAWRLISKGSRFDQIAAEVQIDLKQKAA